jgi:hypothetical protein
MSSQGSNRCFFIQEDHKEDHDLIKELFNPFLAPSELSKNFEVIPEGSKDDFKKLSRCRKNIEKYVGDIFDLFLELKKSFYFWKPIKYVTSASVGIYKDCEFKILPCAFVKGESEKDTKSLIKCILDEFLEKSSSLKKSPFYQKLIQFKANDYEFKDEEEETISPSSLKKRQREEEEEEDFSCERSVEARLLTKEEEEEYINDLRNEIEACSEDLELFANFIINFNQETILPSKNIEKEEEKETEGEEDLELFINIFDEEIISSSKKREFSEDF